MKKLKISMIAVMAIVLGIAASAYTARPAVKQKNMTMHYIEFTGSTNADVGDPGQWDDLGTGTPSLTCNKATGTVCFVKYNGDFTSFESYVDGKSLSQLQADGIIQEYRQP